MNEFTSPAVQAMNLIRYIGDQVSELGKPISCLPEISQEIGSPSKEFFVQLVRELYKNQTIQMT